MRPLTRSIALGPALLVAGAMLVAGMPAAPAAPAAQAAPAAPARHVQWGLFRPTGRAFGASVPSGVVDMTAIQHRQELLNHHVDIVSMYGVFQAPPSSADLEAIAANGSDPMYSVQTFNPTPTYRQTAAGALDGAVAAWAGLINGFAARHPDRTFRLRLDFEMNGPYNRWSPCHKNPGQPFLDTTPADFVASWRHIHDTFMALATPAAVAVVKWVWAVVDVNPVKDPDPCRADLAAFYPGDAYVDEVGMDVYDDRATDSFFTAIKPSYDALASLSNSDGTKPILISELASGHAYGALAPPEPYRANWIDGFDAALLDHFPRVTALVWFDVVKEYIWAIDGCNDPNLPTTEAVPAVVALTDPNTPKLPQNWHTWGGQPFGYTCPGQDMAAVDAARRMLAQPPFSP
jgi:hypothetical protein